MQVNTDTPILDQRNMDVAVLRRLAHTANSYLTEVDRLQRALTTGERPDTVAHHADRVAQTAMALQGTLDTAYTCGTTRREPELAELAAKGDDSGLY